MSTKRRDIRLAVQKELDDRAILYSPDLIDSIADKVLELTATKPRKKSNGTQYYWLAKGLAEVCRLDYDANKGMLFREAKKLSVAQPAPTTELLRAHYGQGGTWYKQDWRGRQGGLPMPAAIRQTWARYASEASNIIEVR